MAEESPWRLLLPRQLRKLPADLVAVVVLTLLCVLVTTLPVVRETPLRVALGFPFVLFLPGYALIAALFPEAGDGPSVPGTAGDGRDDDTGRVAGDADDRFSLRDGHGIDGIERTALSFGLSIAVVPLIGLVLNFTPWGIRFGPLLITVSGFTLVATAVAARRRWEIPPEERFSVPYRQWITAGKTELFEPESRIDAVLNVVLVVSIVLALGSVGFAIAMPSDGESFTEFYYLSETDDGELLAEEYPREFVAGEARPIVVGVENQEHERTNYTVVIEAQNVSFGGPNGTRATIHEREQLARFSVGLAHNRTHHRTVQLRPTLVGDDRRIKLLLYRDAVPDTVSADTAYRDTQFWVNVSQEG